MKIYEAADLAPDAYAGEYFQPSVKVYKKEDVDEEIIKKGELLKEMAEALDKSIRSVSELIGFSRGVDGLHLNGDIAEWDSLRTGGSYEGWLIEFDEAASLLQKYREQVGDINAK